MLLIALPFVVLAPFVEVLHRLDTQALHMDGEHSHTYKVSVGFYNPLSADSVVQVDRYPKGPARPASRTPRRSRKPQPVRGELELEGPSHGSPPDRLTFRPPPHGSPQSRSPHASSLTATVFASIHDPRASGLKRTNFPTLTNGIRLSCTRRRRWRSEVPKTQEASFMSTKPRSFIVRAFDQRLGNEA